MEHQRITTRWLAATAQRYLDDAVTELDHDLSIARLAGLRVRFDPGFATEVAAAFERAPAFSAEHTVRNGYDVLKRESRLQYDAIVDSGIHVEPWHGAGQPYRDSRQLYTEVRRSGTLRVLLTRDSHGPGPVTGHHPMREPAGVTARGVPLTYNDVFRVVHDIFGHVMFGHGFGPRGEFKAAYCHMRMYSPQAHPVLFAEHVGQICWFFFGPYASRHGRVPPDRRPYPEQKIIALERRYLDAFHRMFDVEESA